MGRRITCVIDFKLDDSAPSARAFIQRCSAAEEPASDDELVLDFSRCTYLGPFGAAVLASLFLDWRTRGQIVRVVPPLEPSELRAFWKFSGLEELLATGRVTSGADPANHPNLPLQHIERAGFRAADPVIALVHAHQELPEDWEESIRTCVNEVVQNIQDHSESPIGGVMAARFMRTTSEIRVAIVDRGKGICTTLRRRFPDTSPSNALQRVIEGNYSARSRPNNLGLGISNLASIIGNLNGDFHLISEHSMTSSRQGAAFRYSVLPSCFQGTGVFFILPYHQLRHPR